MAWTASKGMQAYSMNIKLVKGNGLASIIREEHGSGEFQATLADGKDLNKANRTRLSSAAVGARGDYFLLEFPYLLTTGAADTEPIDGIYIDFFDVSGLTPDLAYALFNQDTPYKGMPAARIPTEEELLQILDYQPLGLQTRAGLPAVDATATTAVEQYVRGTEDSRITAYYSLADPTSAAGTAYLKLKPNSDGVFWIPAGSVIWMDNSDDGFGETGA